MNPLFGGMMPNMLGGMNNVGNFMQMIQQVRQARQNPNILGDMLLQNGKINQQQYEAIKQMNGNPQKIGEYLMQVGAMPQQQVQQACQTMVPQVQKEINR